jgi:hypothetical protein
MHTGTITSVTANGRFGVVTFDSPVFACKQGVIDDRTQGRTSLLVQWPSWIGFSAFLRVGTRVQVGATVPPTFPGQSVTIERIARLVLHR